MLLPDTTRPMALPCRVEDLADDPGYRTRMHQITSRHAYAILESVDELARLGRMEKGSAQIRAHQLPPLFKMYILNGDEVFFGLYPLVRHAITEREALKKRDGNGTDSAMGADGV
jgi:hypothetical protein